MTTPTHCVPNPPFPSWAIPTPQVDTSNTVIGDPGAGSRRGILVYFHQSTTFTLLPPFPPSQGTANAFYDVPNFLADMQSNGWVTVIVSGPTDYSGGLQYGPDQWLYESTVSDPTHGAFFVTQVGLWWDHVLLFLAGLYGAGRPIITAGYSLGAYYAALIPTLREWSIQASIMHCLPTVWTNLDFLGNANQWSTANWSGMNLGTTYLNATSIPTIIGTSTADTVVGYNTSGTPSSNAYLIASNAASNGQPCTNNMQSPAEDHLWMPADTTVYLNWVASNISSGAIVAPVNTF